MMTGARIALISMVVLLAGGCGPGDSATVPRAQPVEATFAEVGDFVVHYSTQMTDQLTPEIAKAYGIVRSNNRVMLNISVVRKSDGVSVPAEVQVKTVNLTGQLKSLTMQRHDEPGEPPAIYYIGETTVANQETLKFEVRVKPEGSSTASDVVFNRQFYPRN